MHPLSILLVAIILVEVSSIRINSVLLTTPPRLELWRTTENVNETPQGVPLQSFPVHVSESQVKPSMTIERSAVEDILLRLKSIEEKMIQVKVKKPFLIWDGIVAVNFLIFLSLPFSYVIYFAKWPMIVTGLLLGTPFVEMLVYGLFRSLLRQISSLKKYFLKVAWLLLFLNHRKNEIFVKWKTILTISFLMTYTGIMESLSVENYFTFLKSATIFLLTARSCSVYPNSVKKRRQCKA